MINIFQPASADQSIVYLGQIFGSMSGLLPGGTVDILGTMFRAFNSVVLAIAVLVVIYVTIVGVMLTAHEGQFMGKQWNNIWIPIRTVLGIAALIPTTSGYSALQIVMMWIVLQGIGAADQLWNVATNYVQIFGSPYAQAPLPSATASQTMQQLFQALTCQASAQVSQPDPTNTSGGSYFCAKNSQNGWCQNPPAFNSNQNPYQIGPAGGACGSLTFCNVNTSCTNPNSIQCLTCQAQVGALSSIISTLSAAANQFVQADYQYRNFYANSSMGANVGWISSYCSANNIPQDQCCIPSSSPLQKCQANPNNASNFPPVNDMTADNKGIPSDTSPTAIQSLIWPYKLQPTFQGINQNFIQTAVNYYMGQLDNAIQTYIQQYNQAQGNNNVSNLQAKGWILAGTYYYNLSQVNSNNLEAAIPAFSVNLQSVNQGTLANYRTNMNAAGALMNLIMGGSASGSQSSTSLTSTQSSIQNTMNSVSQTLQSTTGSASNPLSQLQIAGRVLLWTASGLFIGLVTAAAAGGLIGNLNIFVFGTGVDNPVGPTTQLVALMIIPAIYALLGLLVTLGGMLAVYVPLIPYIIFLFGALGWLLAVIEMMVAGPLVALGIIAPSTQHEILGAARPALMLIFTIFLRPSLMIFGLIAALLLASVILSFINAGFGTVVTSLAVYDPIGLMLILTAYVMLIVGALNKCFAAIYLIPNQVMSWISHQASGYGEQEAPSGVRGGIDTVGGRAGSAMGGTGGHIQSAAGRTAARRRDQRQKGGTVSTSDSSKGDKSSSAPGGTTPPP